jgi:hypothetical protein
MQVNMGTIDRVVRLGVALIVAVLIISGQVSGVLAIVLGVVAAIFALTSVVGFCPLYAPFRFTTKR